MKINWDEIESIGKTSLGNDKKIYAEHLPKTNKGIKWTKAVGQCFYVLYDNIEYIVKIKNYLGNRRFIIDLVGEDYNEIEFEINGNNLKNAKIGKLIRNIYVNKKIHNRQLIIDSIGEDNAKTYTCSQNVKIPIKCPHCSIVTDATIHHITHDSFFCPHCTSGTSYPERLMRETLKELGLEYKAQYMIKGYNYRYDFYIPSLNMILETHGEQHYLKDGEIGLYGTISHDELNDIEKQNVALAFGILNYYQIDCRKSELEWCKKHFIEALGSHVDISVITENGWKEIGLRAENKHTALGEVCKIYNEIGSKYKTVVDFWKDNFPELTRKEVNDYLIKGSKLGICNYK